VLLNISQSLKRVCDCSCVPEITRIAEKSERPIAQNAAQALLQQMSADCPAAPR